MEIFDSIGKRLRDERERLKLSQSEIAAVVEAAGVAGATRQSQSLYEKDKRKPDAAYLAVAASLGVDVLYVLTGQRAQQITQPQSIDRTLLQTCIEGLEEGLEKAGRTMRADKKAELIVKLYDLHHIADSPPQKATILQFIKRAA